MRAGRSFVLPLLAFVVPVAIAAAACGGNGDADSRASAKGADVRFRLGNEALPGFLDVPFPSDAYLRDGHFVATFPGLERTFKNNADVLGAQLGLLNGWSRIAPALFAIEDLTVPEADNGEPAGTGIDRQTLPADEDACQADASSVFLIDLEAADAATARVPCRASVLDERDLESTRYLVAIGPARGYVLAEGHRYAAVLTSRVRRESGGELAASDDFVKTAVRKEGPLGALYGAAYDLIAAVGPALATDHAEIIALAPYTTQAIVAELYRVRDALEAAPAPKLSWDPAKVAPMTAARFAAKSAGVLPAGFTASLDDWLGVVSSTAKLPDGSDDPDDSLPVRAHDKLAAVGTAVFDATSFLRIREKKYDDLEHGTFPRDSAGKITGQPAPEAPTAKIWITFAVPTAPMPPEGYPAVIVQHGLNGSRDYLLALANRIASKGYVAVAIDSVTFGARTSNPKLKVDTTSDYVTAPGATYKGGDGISDRINMERAGSFDFFGSLKNLLALRDQLRQAALDTTQVVKLLRGGPDLTPLQTGAAPPKIDPERIAYVGDSLGAIEGAVAAAIEPHVKAWTFNVGGGGVISEAAAHGPVINSNLALAGTVNFGFGAALYSEAHPVVVIAQSLIEAGDPIAYADHLVMKPMPLAGAGTKPRNIFQIEVVFDELVANEANESLARAAGYALASPNVGTNAGIADLATRAPYRGGGIKLAVLPPAPDGYHDVPIAGVTAILVQASPAQHGEDLVRGSCQRTYKLPFNTPEGKLDLVRQEPVSITCPYRALQDTMLRFFGDAFEGRTPVIAGFAAPQRQTR